MSWRPEVEVGGKWSSNKLSFATRKEAMDEAEDMMTRWWSVSNVRAIETDDPVTHTYIDGKLGHVKA